MDATTGSATARFVAVGRAVGVGGRRDEHVGALLPVSDRAAVAALRAVGGGRSRRVLGWSGHAPLRMLAIDAALTRTLVHRPTASVVIVGAGYDTRAWRLPALARRRVIELDHPATQADKRRRLPDAEGALATLTLHPADLSHDDLDAVLDAAGHDPSAPTVWLWEAVVPYLPEAAVDATLRVLAARSAPGSALLVTSVRPALIDPPVLGRALGGVIDVAMRGIREPVLLAEGDGAFASRLARHGFLARAVSGVRRWGMDAGVRVLGPVVDERLHVAEVAA